MITTIEYKIEINDTDTEEKLKKFYSKFFKKLDNRIQKGHHIVINTCKNNVVHNTLKRDIKVHIELLENSKEILKRIQFIEYKTIEGQNDNSCLPIPIKFELEIMTVKQLSFKILTLLEEDKDVVLNFTGVETLTNDIIFKLIGETILGLYDKGKIDNLNKLKFMNTSDYLKIQFKGLYEASSTFFNLKGKPKIITPSYI